MSNDNFFLKFKNMAFLCLSDDNVLNEAIVKVHFLYIITLVYEAGDICTLPK